MRAWPRLTSVLKVWFALTVIGIAALVWVIRQGPPDEEVIFRGFTGQLVLATIEVAVPSFVGLILFLLFGALVKLQGM